MGRKPSRGLRRRAGTRPERRTILIFCEGEKSEPDYIDALKRLPSVRVNRAVRVEVSLERGGPSELVTAAVRAVGDEIDEIWCVFDVEWPTNHPNLGRVLRTAHEYGILTAISNPCFELWLLLHHGEESAFMTTHEAVRKRRALDRSSGKGIDGGWYVTHRSEAIERASALARRHAGNGVPFPRDNPSSSMSGLVRAIDPELGNSGGA